MNDEKIKSFFILKVEYYNLIVLQLNVHDPSCIQTLLLFTLSLNWEIRDCIAFTMFNLVVESERCYFTADSVPC